jgi:DNA-binding transcriptional LysR family regulator
MILTPRAEELAGPLSAALRSLQVAMTEAPTAVVPKTVVIAMRDQFVVSLGALVIRAITAGNPRTEVRFVAYDRERVADELARGTVDVAIAVDPPDATGLRQLVLCRERFVCVAPRRDRLRLRDYLAEGHVVTTAHGGYLGVDAALAKLGHTRRIVVRTDYFAVALHLADELGLVATLPARVIDALPPRRLHAHEPPLEVPGFSVRMVWDARVDADPRARWIRDCVRQATQPPAGRAKSTSGGK